MTREEFKQVLDLYGYSYKEEGGRLLVGGGMVKGEKDHIWLNSTVEIPSGVSFVNDGNLWLASLRRIPSDVVFANRGAIQLSDLVGPGPFRLTNGTFPFREWEGHIKGIKDNLLLNKMIADGLFAR